MRLKIIFFLGGLFISFCAFSQQEDSIRKMGQIRVNGIDTTGNPEIEFVMPDENLNDLFEVKLDSLMNTWYIQNVFVPDSAEINFVDSQGKILPDSVYIKQLQKIEEVIDLSYNKTVSNFIQLYTVKRREQVEIMLGLSAFYFPMFEEILDKYELPLELKYLPIIESALNPRARSRVGATGLWQFMYSTGKMMKLDITSFVDERNDPLKSTEAAVKYLKQLYDIYNDWHLVIAAYNCGPGNVNRAIRRSGGKKDYWSIYYRLPRETRGYVPAYIAASYVMNYYIEHNLVPRYPDFPIVTDTIMVNSLLHFEQIAATLNMDIDELRTLNPMFRRDVIPASKEKPYALRLPVESIAEFIDNQRAIFSHEQEKYFPNNTLVQPASRSESYYNPVDIKGKTKVYYTVKSGDNVGFISEWFNVRASDLRYWNNINRNLIRVGQKLLVYVPESDKEKYEKVTEMSFEAKQQMIGKTVGTTASASVKEEPIDPDFIYYTVRSGDNLWTIAQKFPGVSNKDIMELNNIQDARKLTAGQKLKIKRKA
ncbi:MAG: transglycosylase SLT domain-containing protein [Prolixibacteraceae bacterium]|nr:transglycosylase SLT domain-containing protein [Prolixibacteraceae bacterium]MBN2775459.1 transglycosylase SLT domain-containing protein [Prolixibacteraceae bacterium]